jgi:hypothetical protein
MKLTDIVQHTAASARPAKKASDGFFSICTDNRRILPDLAGTKTESGITVYDANVLGSLFNETQISWYNRLRTRIFTIQAVTTQDATVFKFTIQHAAGDALGMSQVAAGQWTTWLTIFLGLYKAAAAFCEGLVGDVHTRSTNVTRHYTFAGQGKILSKRQPLSSLLETQQARDWFDVCTSSKLFPIKTLARKWKDARYNATRWQTVHFPRSTIEMWQDLARKAGIKVSKFNLLASWIHLVSYPSESSDLRQTKACNLNAEIQHTEPPSLRSDSRPHHPRAICFYCQRQKFPQAEPDLRRRSVEPFQHRNCLAAAAR